MSEQPVSPDRLLPEWSYVPADTSEPILATTVGSILKEAAAKHPGRMALVEDVEFLGDAPALSWEQRKVVGLSSQNGEILFGDQRFQVGGVFTVSGEFISGSLNGAQ